MEPGSPAFEAGLRPDDLVTHVNKEGNLKDFFELVLNFTIFFFKFEFVFTAVQNWAHPQVVHCMLSGGDSVTLRVSPLDQTSIKQGGARKSVGKLARRKGYKQKLQRRALEKKSRKTSLFRRLSGKRASAELSTLGLGGLHSVMQRSASTSEGMAPAPLPATAAPSSSAANPPLLVRTGSFSTAATAKRSPLNISNSLGDSSSSSSPASSVPDSPASPFISALQTRPSSLHGLKHKLAQTLRSPTRRKHAQTIPLSPLARADPAAAAAKDATAAVSNTAAASVLTIAAATKETVQPPPPQTSQLQPSAAAMANHLSSTSPSRSPSPLAAGYVSSSSPSARARSGSSVKKTITKPKKSTDSLPPDTNLLLQTLQTSAAGATSSQGCGFNNKQSKSSGYDSKSS